MELRQRIAAVLDRAIFEDLAPELRTVRTETVRPFVEEKLELIVTKDTSQRHLKYGEYGENGVFTALGKILAGGWAFTSGKRLKYAVDFENSLLEFLRKQNEFARVEIPDNIFRQSYKEGQKMPFASSRYLRLGEDHAEFLCRRFLDVCSDKPHGEMDLADQRNSGLVALVILDTFHANGEDHGAITFSDLFEEDLNPIKSIDIRKQKWAIRRVCPQGKPKLSHKSIGNAVRERYSGGNSNKYDTTIKVFQENILNDLIDLSVNYIFNHVTSLNNILEMRLKSGSLARTVLDVEKGAIFVNQAAHGRFWIFGFCPIEGKVPKADNVMRQKIVKYYESAEAV